MTTSERETVKWYTSGRRFPKMVGRFPRSETMIPGGPYTLSQVVAFVGLLVVGYGTRSLWGGQGLGGIVMLVVVAAGLAWGLGKIPLGGRNVVSVLEGFVRHTTSPTWGRSAGRPLRLPRMHRVQHRCEVLWPEPADVSEPLTTRRTTHVAVPATVATPAQAGTPQPAGDQTKTTPSHPDGQEHGPRTLTGVQQLLEAAGRSQR